MVVIFQFTQSILYIIFYNKIKKKFHELSLDYSLVKLAVFAQWLSKLLESRYS